MADDLLKGKATEAVDLLDEYKQITAKRWQVIRRALDLTSDEVGSDSVMLAVVVSNEWNRKQNGSRDDWDRFLSMGLFELMEFLGREEDLKTADAEL